MILVNTVLAIQLTKNRNRMEKQTKIEVAIYDTKLRLKNIEIEIRLMIREKETIKKQLDLLEIVDDNKEYV